MEIDRDNFGTRQELGVYVTYSNGYYEFLCGEKKFYKRADLFEKKFLKYANEISWRPTSYDESDILQKILLSSKYIKTLNANNNGKTKRK